MLDLFIYYVNEREKVQRRKEAGNLPPWTIDKVLQNHHFCCNRREDDRGTKEIREVVLEAEYSVDELPSIYTLARLLNRWESLQTYVDYGFKGLRDSKANGEKIFNTAYVVSTCGRSMDKLDYVEEVVKSVRDHTVHRTSCRDAFDALRLVDGLGSFLAGQVVADLKNDRYLVDAPDWHTFSVMGPGSKKMLDHIFGDRIKTTEKNYEERITTLGIVTQGRIPPLHRQDLQNCCCEAAKYVKYRLGLGGRVRKYNAHG